ncbi:MAG: isochorismatase family protein [Bryobacteraceae bacterium]
MRHILLFALRCVPLLIAAVCPCAGSGPATALPIHLRTRVQPFKNRDVWEEAGVQGKFGAASSAILICDMWDKHWCSGASRRVEELARRMDPLVKQARAAGILVIHSPSDTMAFYHDYPQRKLMLGVPRVKPPAELKISDPPLPIDDSDGGCDTSGDQEHKAWMRENAILSIGPQDVISDNGDEVYSLLKQRGIQTLFVMGVHTNMCVLNRSFAIRQMSAWGIRCILVRDLTDAMYNPARRPFVSHAAGTELVIEHIEKYWCPSALSGDLAASFAKVAGPGAQKK